MAKKDPPKEMSSKEDTALAEQIAQHGSLDKAIDAAKAAVHKHCKPGQCTCS